MDQVLPQKKSIRGENLEISPGLRSSWPGAAARGQPEASESRRRRLGVSHLGPQAGASQSQIHSPRPALQAASGSLRRPSHSPTRVRRSASRRPPPPPPPAGLYCLQLGFLRRKVAPGDRPGPADLCALLRNAPRADLPPGLVGSKAGLSACGQSVRLRKAARPPGLARVPAAADRGRQRGCRPAPRRFITSKRECWPPRLLRDAPSLVCSSSSHRAPHSVKVLPA